MASSPPRGRSLAEGQPVGTPLPERQRPAAKAPADGRRGFGPRQAPGRSRSLRNYEGQPRHQCERRRSSCPKGSRPVGLATSASPARRTAAASDPKGEATLTV